MIPVLLHLWLNLTGVFFLSPEFTLYPYFLSRSLQPYTQLVDQHFPLILFGPLNLSQFGVINPSSTLFFFIILTLLTDYFAWQVFKRRPLPLWIFVFIQYLLLSSTLWLESVILFLLTLGIYLQQSSAKFTPLLTGLCLSFVIAIKPTLLPFALLYLFFSRPLNLRRFFLLPLIPLLEIIWLTWHQLWPAFLQIQDFNATFYAPLSARGPQPQELIIFTFTLFPIISFAVRSDRLYHFLLLAASLAVLLYPRFHLNHLLPFAALLLVFYPPKIKLLPLTLWLVAGLVLIFGQKYRFGPINYYYPSSLYKTAEYFNQKYSSAPSIYFFGGPDQLYFLTQTLPPDSYYLPSLPWYHAYPDFARRQIEALRKNPDGLVVVNLDSRVDGQTLSQYAPLVSDYLTANYEKIDQIANLVIYENRH